MVATLDEPNGLDRCGLCHTLRGGKPDLTNTSAHDFATVLSWASRLGWLDEETKSDTRTGREVAMVLVSRWYAKHESALEAAYNFGRWYSRTKNGDLGRVVTAEEVMRGGA